MLLVRRIIAIMDEKGKLPDAYLSTDHLLRSKARASGWQGRPLVSLLTALVIILSGTGGFLLGYLAGKDEGPSVQGAHIDMSNLLAAPEVSVGKTTDFVEKTTELPSQVPVIPVPPGGMYVASKNGEAYYLPWCGGVKRIKEENRVWFASKIEAESAGYRPAKNCKGI